MAASAKLSTEETASNCTADLPSCRYDAGGQGYEAEPLSQQGAGGSGGRGSAGGGHAHAGERRVTLGQIEREGIGRGGRPEWVQVRQHAQGRVWLAWKFSYVSL